MGAIQLELVSNNIPEVMKSKETAVRKALKMIGLSAEGYAKGLCPVGTPESTGIAGYMGGTLRNSITHDTDGVEKVVIGTNVEYASYVEFGTSKMAERPYLRPAGEEHLEEYVQMVRECLKQA